MDPFKTFNDFNELRIRAKRCHAFADVFSYLCNLRVMVE